MTKTSGRSIAAGRRTLFQLEIGTEKEWMRRDIGNWQLVKA